MLRQEAQTYWVWDGYAYQSRKHDADDTWNVKWLGYDT